MESAKTQIAFDFDIVERFPEEICRNVFSYLTAEELLSASLVSKDWYHLIGRTPECMKKLILSFDNCNESESACFWDTDDVKQGLTNSTRQYENIELYLYQSARVISTELKNILKIRDRKWKKVDLHRTLFESASDLNEVLSNIDRTVVDLKMKRMNAFEKTEIDSSAWKFPKLKMLTLNCYFDQISMYQNIFANCESLEELVLEYLTYPTSVTTDDVNAIETHKMLKRHKNLKKLTIITNDYSEYLNVDISQGLQCKLTSLRICCRQLTSNQITNLEKLLRTQLKSLESLSLDTWVGLDVAKMIFHMPNLTYLELNSFNCTDENVDLKTIKFHRNAAIIDLHFLFATVDTLRAFFPNLPNVKHLEVYNEINDEILDLIATSFPNLESLSTHFFEVEDVSGRDILKNLKKFDFYSSPAITKEPSCHFARIVDIAKEENRKKYLK